MKQNAIPAGATRPKRRLGRGEGNGHGKTCTRGHKGAKARAGYSLRAGFEGGQMPLFRKLPQRGFNQTRFRKQIDVVNVGELDKLAGDVLDLDTAKAAGLVRGNASILKLLGDGEVSQAITVNAHKCSSSAKAKIEAAGGSVNLLA